jgi:phage shock protein A
MGVIERFFNVVRGWFGLAANNLEGANPEAVYEAAIQERLKRHGELKKAVSNIVYLRNKLEAEQEAKTKDLADVNAQLPVAIESGDDDVALVLLQKKNELEAALTALQGDLETVRGQAESAKQSLIDFQGEIQKLKRERDEMLAKKATAEARIKIQSSLDGLSTDADIKALENVRERIHKLDAEADVGREIQDNSLDAKLKAIKAKTGDVQAKAQLDELKKLHAARTSAAAAEGAAAGKKTI